MGPRRERIIEVLSLALCQELVSGKAQTIGLGDATQCRKSVKSGDFGISTLCPFIGNLGHAAARSAAWPWFETRGVAALLTMRVFKTSSPRNGFAIVAGGARSCARPEG
jgi:hypothetical protein